MSKRLKVVFYLLFAMYITSIVCDIYSFYIFGFEYSLHNYNWLFGFMSILLAFFSFRKKKYILPISFILKSYWLATMPIYGVSREGLSAYIYIYNFFMQGSYSGFLMFLTAWLIPLVSLMGCIYWYLDIKKSKSLDKHWSE
ncbi:MAG: hypothetical protein PQJ44_10370 [Sphaerochaetaceae bacterium]|nr:hypothetical protein [Sphaerochaetaceae bacterium]